jgi:hypothetical protein
MKTRRMRPTWREIETALARRGLQLHVKFGSSGAPLHPWITMMRPLN